MAMEELLHHFGVRTEAREQELHRWLVGSQAVHADLVKDVHELRQFTIVKLASCASRLDSLEGAIVGILMRVLGVAMGTGLA